MRVLAGTSNGYWHSHTEPSHEVELECEVMKGSRQPGALSIVEHAFANDSGLWVGLLTNVTPEEGGAPKVRVSTSAGYGHNGAVDRPSDSKEPLKLEF